MIRSYHELILLPTFEERFEYLNLKSRVADPTFGSQRYLNQLLYRSPYWKSTRNSIIIRDNACDLAHPDYSLGDQRAYVHHINPVTVEDIMAERSCVFDPDNLICCSFQTHNAIHYSNKDGIPKAYEPRTPNDTCPWR